jgi:hypothetical protein
MRVATALLTVLVLGEIWPLAGQPGSGDTDLIRRSGFIFRGTVQRSVASNVKSLAASPSTDIVRVDEILKAPSEFSSLVGREVTVQMRSAASLKEGQQAVFYAIGWLYGDNLAVKEIGVVTGQVDSQNLRSQIAAAERLADEQALNARISSAVLVISGRVVSVRPLISQRESARHSEHDPEYWQADVDVLTVEKGQTANIARRVAVFFAHSKDERWLLSPKFSPGQTGIFLLHTEELQTIKRSGYTALNRLDFQPSSETSTVRRLIGSGR